MQLLHDPQALKIAGIAVAGLGLAALAHVMVSRPNSLLNRGLVGF